MANKDVLTEGELEALMDGFSSGDVRPESPGPATNCEPFDFSAREQDLLTQMPALKNLHEKHAQAFGLELESRYRVAAQVDVQEARLSRMDQALADIGGPVGINLVSIAPLNGLSLVVIPGDLLSFLVDSYFGGGQSPPGATAARESLTPTERRLNDVLLEKFLAALVQAWQGTVDLVPAVRSFESSTAFLQANAPGELALAFPFSVAVGEWSTRIDWLVPYPALEALRLKLSGTGSAIMPKRTDSDWERHFLQVLQIVDLEVVGSFTSERASIADVLSLKRGSILPLKMPTDVAVHVEDQLFSIGEHGAINGHKSIKIKEVLGDRSIS